MSEVSIPDEAMIRAMTAAEQLNNPREATSSQTVWISVEAAAPYIDRAARIDELKREADYHARRADQVPLSGFGGATRVLHLNEWDRIRARIAELEAQQ